MFCLFYSPGACSLAPHIVLEEIGLPFETRLISASGGRDTDTDAWRQVNPKGRVPALTGVPGRIGGADDLLTEAPAILLYLARVHPWTGLLPDDPAAEARVLEWISYLATSVHAVAYGQLWRPQRLAADPALFPALQDQGRANILQQYAYIESLLADGRDWAVPGACSIADSYLLVFFYWGGSIGLPMAADYPAWSALTRKLLQRPAVARAVATEALGQRLDGWLAAA